MTALEEGSSIWKIKPFQRGATIEEAFGHNLPKNFPVIDRFENGIATSIKSLDLDAKTYQSLTRLESTFTKYVDDVAAFNGKKWTGVVIKEGDISGRALDLVVPHAGSAGQQQVIQNIIRYGESLGVKVNPYIYPIR